ncbi:hypothetical protein T265_05755 [Opisthorchis viverrini]|uniref:Uncharacterized protein n=1 Tax=Opisthorchis viverrini TaxID=6198 RepID=A0A074ZIK2_OPIVI|nr:hypothetical protein T265_05755 [Opisthorchis viverrini]KER27138.1 hypothetical protein T265_05755 [Opisthorchis viverrini]
MSTSADVRGHATPSERAAHTLRDYSSFVTQSSLCCVDFKPKKNEELPLTFNTTALCVEQQKVMFKRLATSVDRTMLSSLFDDAELRVTRMKFERNLTSEFGKRKYPQK